MNPYNSYIYKIQTDALPPVCLLFLAVALVPFQVFSKPSHCKDQILCGTRTPFCFVSLEIYTPQVMW